MKLKNYQEKALDWLGRYYERCRALQEVGDRFPVATAFTSDKFYPDFVCKLKNGKFLVVEYKGLDRATNDDTKEKERLGQLWEARSHGDCIFLMIKGPDELSKIADAMAKAA
jgi:hypothetical protein